MRRHNYDTPNFTLDKEAALAGNARYSAYYAARTFADILTGESRANADAAKETAKSATQTFGLIIGESTTHIVQLIERMGSDFDNDQIAISLQDVLKELNELAGRKGVAALRH